MDTQKLSEIWQVFADRERRPEALQLAKDYVNANRGDLEAKYAALTQEQLVTLVGVEKRRGNADTAVEIKTWILSEYPPQQITGTMGFAPRAGA